MDDDRPAGRWALRRRAAVLLLLFLALALAGGSFLYWTVQLVSGSFQPGPPAQPPQAGAPGRDR
jgi:nitrate reductase NapE component